MTDNGYYALFRHIAHRFEFFEKRLIVSALELVVQGRTEWHFPNKLLGSFPSKLPIVQYVYISCELLIGTLLQVRQLTNIQNFLTTRNHLVANILLHFKKCNALFVYHNVVMLLFLLFFVCSSCDVK